MPAPSPKTNPSRSRSHGLLAACGASLRVDKARAARTIDEVDDLASLITAYPRNQQPELSEEIGRIRKRIAAAKKGN